MKIKAPFFLLLASIAGMVSCQKNTVSKIPQIALTGISSDSLRAKDTLFVQFSFVDGDGDIGNDLSSAIYLIDNRYGTILTYQFPPIDGAVEDPKKGLTGTCTFYVPPGDIQPARTDTLHTWGDTLVLQLYITDRAHHQSNVVSTKMIYLYP